MSENSYMQGFKHKCSHYGINPRSLVAKMATLLPPNPDNTLMAAGGVHTATDVAQQGPKLQQQMQAAVPKVTLPKLASTETLPPLSRPKIVRKPISQTSDEDHPVRPPVARSAGPYGT